MQVNIGKGIDLDVPEFDTFSPEVRQHIIYIGFRNVLMDSHAGITPDKVGEENVVDQSKAVAQKKLDSLIAGEVRTMSFREGDPVKKRAIELITGALIRKARTNGQKLANGDAAKQARELLSKAEPDNKFMVQARKDVEAAKAMEADLDDLGV